MSGAGSGATMGRTARTTTMRSVDEEFAAYMAARQPALLRTAYLLTGDPHTAEDVVQTALAKLYLAWESVHRREAVDAYVRRIMVNECHSLWRRPWRRREVATERLPERAFEDPHDDGVAAEVWAVVATLPPRQRAVIVLRYYEQLSEAEIAATLGISTGTVKSQASRALAALRARTSPPEGRPVDEQREEER